MRSFLEEQLGFVIGAAEAQFLGRERSFLRGLSVDRLQDRELWLEAREMPPAPKTVDRVCRIVAEHLSNTMRSDLRVRVTLARKGPAKGFNDIDSEPLVDSGNLEAFRALDAYARDQLQGVPCIYLYGGSGLGKTRLLRWFQQQVGVACTSWDALALHRELQSASRIGRLQALRSALEASEVFLLDEVHRLRGKRRTQEELGRVIDLLAARRRRVLFCGRHHPYQIREFRASLASRLLGGYTIGLRAPTLATRKSFAKRLWDEQVRPGLRGDRERSLCLYQASMSGAQSYAEIVQRAHSFQQQHAELGVEAESQTAAAGRPLLDPGQSRQHESSQLFELLKQRVARAFGIDAEALSTRDSSRRLSLPRQVLAYLVYEQGMPGPEIARRLGWRSASSVTYAIRRVKERMSLDDEFARLVESCR
ncbi:MAG: hypothetical protein CSA62_10315 [Planctomycetota bacterium]|nr:MAG: hypothetical protein CSA62_10315 [Planctomycetota bacterium]